MAHNSSSDGNGFKHDVQSLRGGVDTLTSDVSNLAHSTADAARSGTSELRQRAQDAVETTKAKLDSAKTAAADATQSLKGVISTTPWPAWESPQDSASSSVWSSSVPGVEVESERPVLHPPLRPALSRG